MNINCNTINKYFVVYSIKYEVLNGKDYMRLFKCLLNCLKYRDPITSEFN